MDSFDFLQKKFLRKEPEAEAKEREEVVGLVRSFNLAQAEETKQIRLKGEEEPRESVSMEEGSFATRLDVITRVVGFNRKAMRKNRVKVEYFVPEGSGGRWECVS